MAEELLDVRTAITGAVPPELSSVDLLTPTAYLAVKRLLDIAVSFFLLVVLLPALVMIGIAVRLSSPGPALFRQHRIGKGGTAFTIYKFRTMVTEAPPYSYKVPISDPRITPFGKWLRRTGLDEVPQLWNVLRGDMSLIGPRPEMPFIVKQHHGWNHVRYAIRPGITGWWQIHHREDVPMHLNLEYDLYYLEHLAPRLDWLIVRKTVRLMVTALIRGAG